MASIELFTAGGSSSDLEIPGLLLSDAQNIKNLVSHKINPPVTEEMNIGENTTDSPELNAPNENE